MGLFPEAFLDDLRGQADIVLVIQDYVPLKRAGASYRGLCPFHAEKTPSFNVNRDRGFFHCFGCGVGGDVFKFLELREQIGFQDAVKRLAQRFGLALPDLEKEQDRGAAEEREGLLKLHEMASSYFRAQLESPAGARARQLLRDRGLTPETVERLGVGFAPPQREGLKAILLAQGVSAHLMVRSGLVIEREDGTSFDRFRNRILFPICRDSGSVVAFGGRAMTADQQPKYLNSPETAIYSKGRLLYGVHVTKAAIRRLGYAVIVEGYFDFAQALQAGVSNVVASCGTALTTAQAHGLRNLASRVILSFDPDAAGQTAAIRSCDLLVAEDFEVKVALLPTGLDPDSLIRQAGREAYTERLRSAQPYLDYLLDRAAERHDLGQESGRRAFLDGMLAVAARIPNAAARDQFADRLAHKARILEEVVRTEIRKAAAARRTSVAITVSGASQVKPAEKGLIWALKRDPATALAALAEAEEADFEGLATAGILRTAWGLRGWAVDGVPETLFERLSKQEVELVRDIAESAVSPAPPVECVRAFRRQRYERERAALQQEIDRLQGIDARRYEGQIDALWQRKRDLSHRIEALGA
jgi:DNA primase